MIETCVDNIESILNAIRGGSKRIELCSALCLGGLTPSVGFMKTAKKFLPEDCKIFVMIRPKPGEDYMYNENEVNIMIEDIKTFKELGADGFVFGCLTEEKKIDLNACKKLLAAAEGFPCTFHRAFDVMNNPEESLKIIISLGFARLLTSGQEENAFLGRNVIKKLVLKARELKSDIVIMPGGGINLNNLEEILKTTEAKEFHGSAREKPNKDSHEKNLFWITNESIVKNMIDIARNIHNN